MQNERPGYSLQSADLVHEVYLRLVNARELDWQHRAHFFAVAATLMRRILLDRARRQAADKRGGKAQPLDLTKTLDVAQAKARELVALDDALNALAEVDPRKSRIVELRFFGGLSVKETAEVVKVSSDTVMRDWKMARAWLLTELSSRPSTGLASAPKFFIVGLPVFRCPDCALESARGSPAAERGTS